MPKTIHSLTLLDSSLTLVTRLAVSKVELACSAILADAHDIHVAILQLTHIPQLLDTIPLSMNCEIAVSTATTPTSARI